MLSDMALEVIGDFAVVWLLSPTRSFSPVAKNSMARYINGLPGHALQVCLLVWLKVVIMAQVLH